MNASLDTPSRLIPLLSLLLLLTAWGCRSTETTSRPAPASRASAAPTAADRGHVNDITSEVPPAFTEAIQNGTRTPTGKPGPRYWQQQSDYEVDVRILPDQKQLQASGVITYYNNSPDTLRRIYLELSQNVHQPGVPRNEAAEITRGISLQKLQYGDQRFEVDSAAGGRGSFINGRLVRGYQIDGTLLTIAPREPLMPGNHVEMKVNWSFEIPQRGAGGRMGYSADNLFFIAYWYPKVRMYDDVYGWFTDPFLGNAEFYNEFGNYHIRVTAPEDWLVAATGSLRNADEVLRAPVLERWKAAHASDTVMQVASGGAGERVTQPGMNGTLTWDFIAEDVNDFAFSLTRDANWDATRTPVGDRDGDGTTDYVHIDALYRGSAPLWKQAARYEQQAIQFLSSFTGLAYPWPHMTAVEGGGIIGGGMEFPMMTLTGAYQGRRPQDLYAVIAHELAHMWVPMQVATNERWYAWMDEGSTTFSENQARKAFYPGAANPDIRDFESYLSLAGTGREGEIMRRSDYHYSGSAYGVASYPKPASVLVALRGLLGTETFMDAYRTFMQRWQFKHPYPWDFFNTVEDVSGRELDWFWRSWYYETWTLDQGVAAVTPTDRGTRIVIRDYGRVPMPAPVEITLADGSTLSRTIDVETWLRGTDSAILTIEPGARVRKVVIDPDYLYPDANRANNVWERK